MPEYVSKDIHPCECGKEVAWLNSKTGNKVPHDIKREISVGPDGTRSVVVSTEDFHYCARYPELAKFIQEAIERSRQEELRIHLPNRKQRPYVLNYRRGEVRARVTDGGTAPNERTYGSINVQNGGYRVRNRGYSLDDLNDLLELLGEIDKNPRRFDWSVGETQTWCCICGRPLTNETSVHWGYGPVCAEHVGLPWY